MKAIKSALLGLALLAAAGGVQAQNEQFIPVLSYRVGPYAAGGSGFFGGSIDYFNLINASFLKSLDGPTKNIVIPKLMPAALNWFRHGATVTVLAGVLLYGHMYHKGGTGAVALAIGGLLGIIMMGNVHGIIWPNQKKIIAAVTAAAQGTPAPPEMAQWGRTALLASRVNFMLSIPMLFFMGAGSHFR